MKMDKSVRIKNMSAHYGPTSHKSNSAKLPDGRNPGQQNHMSIQQTCVPAPGSPVPTQASKSARGKIGNM